MKANCIICGEDVSCHVNLRCLPCNAIYYKKKGEMEQEAKREVTPLEVINELRKKSI